MTVAVDDADHQEWREVVLDLVDEWRSAIDVRDHPSCAPILLAEAGVV